MGRALRETHHREGFDGYRFRGEARTPRLFAPPILHAVAPYVKASGLTVHSAIAASTNPAVHLQCRPMWWARRYRAFAHPTKSVPYPTTSSTSSIVISTGLSPRTN